MRRGGRREAASDVGGRDTIKFPPTARKNINYDSTVEASNVSTRDACVTQLPAVENGIGLSKATERRLEGWRYVV